MAGAQSGRAASRQDPRPDAALACVARSTPPCSCRSGNKLRSSPVRLTVLAAFLLLAAPALARQQLDTLTPAQAISRAAAASPKPVRALFQLKVQNAAKS